MTGGPAGTHRGTTERARRGFERRRAPSRSALRIIAIRLIQIPWTLVAMSALVFLLVQVVPGDPGRNALGPYATATQVAAWEAARGMDAGALERYSQWLSGFLVGDWGTSIVYAAPVLDLVTARFLNSMALGVCAFAILVPLAVGIGVLQARVEGSRRDRFLTVAMMSLAAIPEFVVGVLLLIVFAVVVPVFPVQSGAEFGSGPLPPLRSMVLPAITLALGSVAVIARTTRAGVVEVTRSQYFRTAVVKGVDGGALFRRHIARNALIPTVSLLGVLFGAFLAGSAVVETLFGYPGLGELLVTATQRKDAAVLAAGVMVTGTIAMFALLATDVAFAFIDPRVSFRGLR